MIRFFSKKHQEISNQNNISKYLRYAIGEIFLVVIGILIALQINNWNEEQKAIKEEIIILKELKNSITTDIQQLNNLHRQGDKDIASSEAILNWIEDKVAYNDTLEHHLTILSKAGQVKLFTPQNSAYKVLESKGIDLISNLALKNQILDLYNIEYPKLNFEYENYRQNVVDFGRPIARSSFRINGKLGAAGNVGSLTLVPDRIGDLKKNIEFYNTIKVLQLNNESINLIITRVLARCQKIKTFIGQEIGNK